MRFTAHILYCFAFLLIVSCKTDDDAVDDTNTVFTDYTGEVSWLKTLGGSGVDEGNNILLTVDGGFMIVGTTSSTDGTITDKTSNDNDIWVVKVDSAGEVVWNKTYGSSENDRGYDILATNDGNFLISGYVSGADQDVSNFEGFHDYWIFKINASGDVLWDKSFGFSGSDQAKSIIQTNDGGFLLTGFFDVTASNGQGNELRPSRGVNHGVGDFWVIKLDGAGNTEWRNYFGGSNDDRSFDVVQTMDNSYIVAGAAESVDFDVEDNHGGHDFWVVKVAQNGTKIWTKSFGGSEIDNGYALIATQDGNFILTGDTRSVDGDVTNSLGNADSWIVKFDTNGSLIWEKTIGGSLFESSRGITNLNNGNYVLTGSTRSVDNDVTINKGLNDAWLYIVNEEGTLLFEKTIGGASLDFGINTIESADDGLVMIGNTESNNGDITTNLGFKDLLLVKIN